MNGRSITGISGEVLKALESYSWPGNVRELEHLMERATIFENGTVLSRSSLPEEFFSRLAEDQEPLSLEANERRVIARALTSERRRHETGGVHSQDQPHHSLQQGETVRAEKLAAWLLHLARHLVERLASQ